MSRHEAGMRTLSEVVVMIERVDRAELRGWVERGWVTARRERGELLFTDFDVARISLICDLRRDLMVDEETVPLVLSLLDQVYTLRRQMTALTGAIHSQPEAVRRAILDHLRHPDPDHDILDL